MTSGSELVKTWIPDGGFKIERRKVRTPDGTATVTECLVPKWDIGELTPDRRRLPARERRDSQSGRALRAPYRVDRAPAGTGQTGPGKRSGA
jgi:hypothetical protein